MGRRNSTYRTRDSPELNRGDSASGSITHKSKKRKSSSKHIVEGDSSQSPASDACAQQEAGTLKMQTKGNKISRHTQAPATKVSGYSGTDCNNNTIVSSSLEDRKSDLACKSMNTEAAESISYSQSQGTEAKKRRRSKKIDKSVSNAASISEGANEAVVKIDKDGSSTLDREEANVSVVRQDIGSAPSTICDQSMEPKGKKRKKRSKSNELNSNADVSSKEKSDQGGDFPLSVSVVNDKCNQAVAEVLQPQRKKHDKAGGILNQGIDSVPSTVCDGIMESKEKKRKRPSQSKKFMGSVSDAGGNCKAIGFTSQENSHQGGDLSLSVVSDTSDQAVAENLKPQRKKHDKAGGISNQDTDSTPSTVCDGIVEPKAKKRKRPSKPKKFTGSVSDADGNCEASGFTSQENSHQGGDSSLSVVSNTSNQAVAEVLQQRKEIGNPVSIVNQDVDSAPSTACDQKKQPEGEKRKKQRNRGKKKKKIIDSIPDADTSSELGGTTSQKKVSVGSSGRKQRNRRKKKIIDSIADADTNPELGGTSSQKKVSVGSSSRKLVILDLNGLLADIRSAPLKGCKPDKWIVRRAVYKRPFCDEFLQFCVDTFDVAVWSSRRRANVQQLLSFIMSKDNRNKLIFIRDQSHCTKTGFKTIGNKDKPIFLKELKHVWNKSSVYNQCNTLLIDDSPCKALCNPPYTGIFPNTYECSNNKDDSLGPNGDLRLYLKKLAEADDVKEFVKENPFGQTPITDLHPSWEFYSKVIASNSKPPTKKKSKKAHCPPAVRRNNVNPQEGVMVIMDK